MDRAQQTPSPAPSRAERHDFFALLTGGLVPDFNSFEMLFDWIETHDTREAPQC